MTARDTKRIIEIQQQLHEHLPSDPALRVKALESLLVEKKLLSSESVDRWIELYSEEIGPRNGAKVVARAWCEPDFKQRLLSNATEAIAEMGFLGMLGSDMVAVENTSERHNVVVCTLCSCYPWPILGLPPTWYKSHDYRSRVVRQPREVLREFGLELSEDIEIRVWDSTSDIRYLVLPERPAGTDHLNQDQLAALVTRNAMIGTERVAAPISEA